jgi:Zn-dependent peptidase ImmA (M78 family)
MARRSDILAAVYAADRLHKQFDTKARAEAGEGRIDVFDMLVKRDIPVLFRPLDKLLGAFINDPDRGIMVTSRRALPVQRFTAAHELGHEVLGHEASFDEEEVLTRALFATQESFDPREVQANAFASQLLTPHWLIAHHMKRQGWTRQRLNDPVVVYQLALRMGSSYTATCYALEESKAIDRRTRETLINTKPKSIKQSLVNAFKPDSWYGDVWLVTDRDTGTVLEGSRSDLVILRLEEHASAGYLWQFGQLADAGLVVRDNDVQGSDDDHIGGVVFRTVIAEAERDEGASGHLSLREVRPWQAQGDPLHAVELDIDLAGPVSAGLLPQQREALLGAA